MLEEHTVNFPGRDVDSIKRKWCSLYRRKAPSGDPTIPAEVLMAKRIKKAFGDKAMIATADEVYDMDGEGTFTSANGIVRPSTNVASV